jgi:hypothetical protein
MGISQQTSNRLAPCVLTICILALSALMLAVAVPLRAESATTIESLQAQIDALQKQVNELKAAQAKSVPSESAGPATKASVPESAKNVLTNSSVKLTLGGFIEATGIYRNRFTGSDVNSKWNVGAGGFPLPNSPNYYMNELRGTARQSRLSLLAQGQDDYAALAGYFEVDFLGGANASSANSQESNSYYPRIRHLYGTYDTTGGWHLLAGQAFSLITMNKVGIVPRQENIPLTIDPQYIPGFTWTRNPQIRLVKDFNKKLWAGLSLEAPQAIVTGGGLPAGNSSGFSTTSNYTFRLSNPSNFANVTSTTNNSNLPGSLTLDEYPDVIGKVAFDPGFGHYEVYGLARFFTDRTLVNGRHNNETTFGWGAGGAVLLPIVPKLLEFQGTFLAGQGIGRYGSAQFFDAVVNPISGKLDPLNEVMAFAGLVAHPTDRLDIFAYAGMEQAARKDVLGTTGGFGNPAYAPNALLTEGSTASSALVQASAVQQATLGAWYSVYKGGYGLLRVGLTDAYTHLRLFGLPSENINTVMMSFRYFPF